MGKGDKNPEFVPVGIDSARDLIALNRRGGILVASPRLIALLDPSGAPLRSDINREFVQSNTAADLREPQLAFNISPDAQVVRFETYEAARPSPPPIAFNLGKVPQPLSADDALATEAPNQDPNIVDDWRNSRAPRIVGQPLPSGESRKDARNVTAITEMSMACSGQTFPSLSRRFQRRPSRRFVIYLCRLRRFLPPCTIEDQEAPRFALAYLPRTTQWPTAAATGFCFAPWSKVWAKPFAAMISRPPSAIGEGSVWPPNRLLPMIQSEMHLEGCF